MTEIRCLTCCWSRPLTFEDGVGRCVIKSPPPGPAGFAQWPRIWLELDFCGEHPEFAHGGHLPRKLKAIRVRVLEAKIDQALKRSDVFTADLLTAELAKLVEEKAR